MKRRVVVTGMGVITPLSLQVDDMFRRLCAGESGIRPLKGFDTANHKVNFGGEVQDFEPGEKYLDHKDHRRLDRFTIFAIVAATDALEASGLDFEKEDRWRCGAIVASGIGGLWELETQVTKLVEKGPSRGIL